MKRLIWLDLALTESSAASEIITLHFSTAPLPKVNWPLNLLEQVFSSSIAFWIGMGQRAWRGDD